MLLELLANSGDVSLDFPCCFHDLGGGAGMDAQLVDDLYVALWHQVITE